MKISLLGYGTVGSGVINIIENNNERNITKIEINNILVKNIIKHKNKKYFEKVTDDFQNIINADSDVIIEAIGGIHPAYEYVKMALESNKHVVTANKDLIAEYGYELFDLAEKNNVMLKFEAAVAGGIPIIKAILESLKGNKISKMQAILNGTTNFILTQMDTEKLSYEKALKKAQELGFAECDPKSDVEGYDSARKLALLSTLAFKNRIHWSDIDTTGITNLSEGDFKAATSLKCKIKLVAYSENCLGKVHCKVMPAFVKAQSQLYNIANEINSVILDCDSVGKVSFIGSGAGSMSTASSVISDLIDIENKGTTCERISNLFKNKVNIEKYSSNKWAGVLVITTKYKQEVISILEKTIKINLINILEELVVIQCSAYTEKLIDTAITELMNLSYINEARKFLVIE